MPHPYIWHIIGAPGLLTADADEDLDVIPSQDSPVQHHSAINAGSPPPAVTLMSSSPVQGNQQGWHNNHEVMRRHFSFTAPRRISFVDEVGSSDLSTLLLGRLRGMQDYEPLGGNASGGAHARAHANTHPSGATATRGAAAGALGRQASFSALSATTIEANPAVSKMIEDRRQELAAMELTNPTATASERALLHGACWAMLPPPLPPSEPLVMPQQRQASLSLPRASATHGPSSQSPPAAASEHLARDSEASVTTAMAPHAPNPGRTSRRGSLEMPSGARPLLPTLSKRRISLHSHACAPPACTSPTAGAAASACMAAAAMPPSAAHQDPERPVPLTHATSAGASDLQRIPDPASEHFVTPLDVSLRRVRSLSRRDLTAAEWHTAALASLAPTPGGSISLSEPPINSNRAVDDGCHSSAGFHATRLPSLSNTPGRAAARAAAPAGGGAAKGARRSALLCSAAPRW